MTTMRFAADILNSAHLASLLQSPRLAGHEHWLIIDRALFDIPPIIEHRLAKLGEHFNTLEDSELAGFASSAPLALKLSTEAVESAVPALAALQAQSPRATGLSVVCSARPASDLKQLFAYLAHPRLDDDLAVHCRFADTRVLPALLQSLTSEQSAHCASVLAAWHWLDRRGSRQTWTPHVDAQPTPFMHDTALRMDASQYGDMLDIAEPDLVFATLADTVPELIPDDAGADLHDKLLLALSQASQLEITQPSDRRQYAVLVLSLGESFYRHAALADTWRAVAAGASFSLLMQAWSDELWNTLETAARGEQ